ncbi:MAG: phosphomannomutase/phosphoglucomutase [Ilumatobacteraceae bacterium]
MSVLDEIVKAYDIRGTVPDQLNADVARALGVAFARYAGAEQILIGRDMRPSGPALVAAFTDGVLSQGVDVVDIGLTSSDLVYFAAGDRDRPGVIFTASHNPAQYNGVKMCLEGARPVATAGLGEIKAMASTVLEGHGPADAVRAGRRTEDDLLPAFVEHVLSFIDVDNVRSMRVVADTANGMGGLVVPAVFERLPMIDLEVMYPELDGTFPNHPADPLQPANQRDLRARVKSGGFDVGLAFDGDADRVFVVDEQGIGLSGSTTTAMLAAAVLRGAPGGTVLYNLICSRSVPEVIRENGGVPVRTKVGHSFIKQVMADTGAVFGGEHSAHYYFARNYCADSGLIATMLVLGELSRSSQELSIVRKPFERYSQSGEINTHVADVDAVLDAVRAQTAGHPQDDLDGLSVDCGSWWFNLRPSNTEPLLRLNLEAETRDECDAHVAEILALITSV